MRESSITYRTSLLNRLRHNPGDPSAWDEFVARYRPMVLGWCSRWGLQEADAQDVTQMVLLRLAVKMRTFVYDPNGSFRGWLKTLARHAWYDFVSDQSRDQDHRVKQLDTLFTAEARIDLEQRLNETFDLELLEIASDRVKERVNPQTWRAFELTAMQRLSGAEAAERLGMNVGSIFKARSNVQRMLRAEIERLERGARHRRAVFKRELQRTSS